MFTPDMVMVVVCMESRKKEKKNQPQNSGVRFEALRMLSEDEAVSRRESLIYSPPKDILLYDTLCR